MNQKPKNHNICIWHVCTFLNIYFFSGGRSIVYMLSIWTHKHRIICTIFPAVYGDHWESVGSFLYPHMSPSLSALVFQFGVTIQFLVLIPLHVYYFLKHKSPQLCCRCNLAVLNFNVTLVRNCHFSNLFFGQTVVKTWEVEARWNPKT